MTDQPKTARAAPVELAPRHKVGLSLDNPVMLGSGVAGYGEAIVPGCDLAVLGGLVTAPLTRRPWRGDLPALHEIRGGLLWQPGWWNLGVRQALRWHGPLWRRSLTPIIAHIAGRDEDELAAVAEALEHSGVAALQIDLFPTFPASWHDASQRAASLALAIRGAADLPILARLPWAAPLEAAQALRDVDVDCLVVAQPPAGVRAASDLPGLVSGSVYGPLLASLVAAQVETIAAQIDLPVIGAGGIHSVEDALLLLRAGATAIQIDTAVWVDPTLPVRVVMALAQGLA